MKRKPWMLWCIGLLVAASACFVIFVWIPMSRFAREVGSHLSSALAAPAPGSVAAEHQAAGRALLDDFFWISPASVFLCANGSNAVFAFGDGQVADFEVRRLEPPNAEMLALRANPRGAGFALIANSVRPIDGARSGNPRIELWLREDEGRPWHKCTRDGEFKSTCSWMRSGNGILYTELPEPDAAELDEGGTQLPPLMRIQVYDIPTEGIRPYSKLAYFDMIYSLSDETESGVYCEGRIGARHGIWKVVPGEEPKLELACGSAPTLSSDGRSVLCVRASDASTWPAWRSEAVDLLRFSADRTGEPIETLRSAINLPVRSLVTVGPKKVVLVGRALNLPKEAGRERLSVVDL